MCGKYKNQGFKLRYCTLTLTVGTDVYSLQRFGGHALARVARRGRIWHHQQHHHQTHGRVHNERQVRCLPGHLCLPLSTGLAAGQRPPGSSHQDAPPPTAPIRRQQHSPRRRLVQAAALLQMQAQTRSLSPQAPKTTATANSSFRSSTASTRHSSGVRFPPRRLP
jgi:hypothetical protein